MKLALFDCVFIKDFDNSGWQTSDDPVILLNNWAPGSILSINTEVIFPLSKDFCLYMHHRNAKNGNNPLRKVPNGTFVQAQEEMRSLVTKLVFENAHELMFFPAEFTLS